VEQSPAASAAEVSSQTLGIRVKAASEAEKAGPTLLCHLEVSRTTSV
jgi:hypothetical protein